MKLAPPPAHRRSKLFVDRRLQGGIVVRILLHWLTFVAVGTGIAVTLRWLTHPTVPLSEQVGEMFAAFGPFLVALVALLPIFVVDTIKLTNRFAGPYVRFRRHIRAIVADEAPAPVKFRDGDYWRETEEDLNALLAEIGELRREMREHKGGPTVSLDPEGGRR
ncbi:MAG: hypothetical protein AB7U20_14560 [Planctomycetaceae bacterium]